MSRYYCPITEDGECPYEILNCSHCWIYWEAEDEELDEDEN